MHTSLSHPQRPVRTILRTLAHERRLVWLFIRDDISSTIIPALLMTLTAWKVSSHSWLHVSVDLARAFVYFIAYIYLFCLSNQLVGIEEDRINKPHRPLVSHAVTIHGAQWRLVGVTIVFAGLGAVWHVYGWTLLWIITTFLHNQGGWSRHWFGKHSLMASGIIAQLGAAWEMITPLQPMAWQWIAVIAWLMMPLVGIQDLRDIAGDINLGRRTMPIIWGHVKLRVWLATLMTGLPVFVHFSLFALHGWRIQVVLCDALIAGLCWLIAYRVAVLRTTNDDHQTYLLFTYWYCSMLFSALIVF